MDHVRDLKKSHEELSALLSIFGDFLPRRLSLNQDLEAYADKLAANAEVAYAMSGGDIVGMLALYANEKSSKRAFLPLITVLPTYRGQGIGATMLQRAIAEARSRNMKSVALGRYRDTKRTPRNFIVPVDSGL